MMAVGIQSGTSADGIDAVLVKDVLEKPQIVEALCIKYRSKTRRAILSAISAREVAQLNRDIACEFAGAIKKLLSKTNLRPSVIGSHGQTIMHIPGVSSLQIGSPAMIAAMTGIPVAADFRSDDIAVGGQGAPLVPILDQILLKAHRGTVAALNLGGIANVTILVNGKTKCAYDIGPANAMIDAAMRLFYGKDCDRNAAVALSGLPNHALLQMIDRHPYFRKSPPKTTGPEEFGIDYVTSLRKKFPRINKEDFVTSLSIASTVPILRELKKFAPTKLYVSGGGVKNPLLVGALGDFEIFPHSDFKEALLFAVLGAMRFNNIPADLRRITGAKRPKILGGLWTPN